MHISGTPVAWLQVEIAFRVQKDKPLVVEFLQATHFGIRA
jgi:hypothetical protein